MLGSLRYPALLAALSATMFLANLGGAHLWDVDEAIFSQAAKEMHQRGDYVVPYFNGEVFPDKPPVMYWAMIAAYELFGPTEFAARFFSAVFGVGSVLLTYRLGALMFSPVAGFWSGLVLSTTLNFNIIARAATPDAYLVFFVTLAVLVFVSGTPKARVQSGEANERNAPWSGQTHFEPSWPTYALAYAAMGCAVLTKGPIGVVLPTAILGLFLLIVRAQPIRPSARVGWRGALVNFARWLGGLANPAHFFSTAWSMRPLTAVASVLAVAAGWYVWVGLETDGQWLVGFFGVHNFGRFLNAMENHRGPVMYYGLAIAVGFFPWSVMFWPILLRTVRHLSARQAWRPGYVLVGSWIAVWVGFFSLAGTKLPSYVVPAYPAIALAVGSFVALWLREPELVPRVFSRIAWGIVALVGVGMIVALPIVAHLFLEDDWILGAIGILPLAAAAVGWRLSERGQVRGALGALASLGVLLPIALFALGAAYVDRYQDTPPLAERIARETPPGRQAAVGSFHFFRPSFVFYSDCPVAKFETVESVDRFFADHPDGAFVMTNDFEYEKLRTSLPADVKVLEERRRFLRKGSVLLLGRTADWSTARSPSADPVPH
jgi:4-amino-4-deoxy-L-arabinose transferase-like glycosyltransferase